MAAGAGAGKTAVLVERVIQGLLQEDGLDIERLLVVTFTEAAAAEMRERIRGALEESCGKSPPIPGCSSSWPGCLWLLFPPFILFAPGC